MSAASSTAWRCVVCGYIHHGDAPPDLCPVCGAPAADFEAFTENPEPAPFSVARRWRCTVCGYEHAGVQPPDVCPLCGAGRDSFEAIFESEPVTTVAGQTRHIVIVGGGVAAISAAEAARRASPEARITLLSREPHPPYYRLNLTRLLAGEIGAEELVIHPPNWYAEQRIDLRIGTEVTALTPDNRSVRLADNATLNYDQLVLATGAEAFIPPLPGVETTGVMAIRTRDDVAALARALQPGVRCVCLGGGILGLETAGALARRGADVTLLESHTYLMPRQLPAPAGETLKNFIAGLGIRLRTGARTHAIIGAGRVTGVRLDDGTVVPADLVTVTTGVRPNIRLAQTAGLRVSTGVLVDARLQTSEPGIYAAGDVCEHGGVLYGSWSAAQFQGRIAGANAAGDRLEFGGLPRAHTLKVLGLGLTSIGRFEPEDGRDHVVEAASGHDYRRFVFDEGRLIGAVLLGDTRPAAAATQAIEKKTDFSKLLSGMPSAADVATALQSA